MKKLTIFFIYLFLTVPCGARTISVDDDGPADFNNIQAAINDSNDGDIVLVADGIYAGTGNRDIDFGGRAIIVRSENGPNNCIINCNGTETEPHRGFYFHTGEDANSVLDGFTITGGYGPEESIVRVLPPYDVLILSVGGAVYCEYSSPTLTNCIITSNSAGDCGGGVYCYYSAMIVIDCVFDENIADRGAGMQNDDSEPVLFNCIFSGNKALKIGDHWGGGGIFNNIGAPQISRCIFIGNSSHRGGAIHNVSSTPIITNCLFSRNLAWQRGGGIYNFFPFTLTSPILTNCTFIGNYAPSGRAIYCDYSE